MKQLFVTLGLLIPLCLSAQEDKKPDMNHYLAGTVPVVEGKVTFVKEIQAPGLSKEQIYQIGGAWLEKTLKANENKSGIVYQEESKGEMAGVSEHYLVFKSTAFSLDRATANYMIVLNVDNGKCEMQIKNIRYQYNSAQPNGPDRYAAEELITDESALNKAGTKLFPMPGKFRMKTIDQVNELAEDLRKAMEAAVIKSVGTQTLTAQTAPPSPAQAVQVSTPAQSSVANTAGATTGITTQAVNPALVTSRTAPVSSPAVQAIPATGKELAGYKNIAPDKIPGNIIKMLSQDWMLITAGNSTKFNTMTASWGGLGVLFNKPVAICFVNPARYTYQLMESGDTYTLTFYTETYRDALNYCGKVSGRDTDKIKGSGLTPIATPDNSMAFSEAWMIIECRKLVSQSLSPDAIHNPEEKAKRSTQAMHKMYIGEIINVWVK